MKNKENNTPAENTTANADEAVTATAENQSINPNAITTVAQRTVSAVFEKLQQGQRLQEGYQNAKVRLVEIENFKNTFDGSGLELTIVNRDGEAIKFHHQESISQYLDSRIEHGKEVLGFMESNIVSFAI